MNRFMGGVLSRSVLFLMAGGMLTHAVEPGFVLRPSRGQAPSQHCQILDETVEPLYSAGLTYLPTSEYAGHGRTGQMELDAGLKIAFFEDVAQGDLDVGARFRGILYPRSANIGLPNQLASLAADITWSWRFHDGFGAQFLAAPGFYWDIEDLSLDMLFVPFSGRIIRTYNRDVSAILGLDIRPGFETLVVPVIGVDWQIHESLRLRARFPESRMTAYFQNWSVYAGYRWDSQSYRLKEKGPYDRDLFTIEDQRLFLGAVGWMSPDLHVFGEVGRVFDRSVEFGESVPDITSKVNIGSTQFLRFGVGGPF